MGEPSSVTNTKWTWRLARSFSRNLPWRLLLPELALRLGALAEFTLETAEAALRSFAEERQVKPGLLINASRVLLTGKAVAPGIFEVMVALGTSAHRAKVAATLLSRRLPEQRYPTRSLAPLAPARERGWG